MIINDCGNKKGEGRQPIYDEFSSKLSLWVTNI